MHPTIRHVIVQQAYLALLLPLIMFEISLSKAKCRITHLDHIMSINIGCKVICRSVIRCSRSQTLSLHQNKGDSPSQQGLQQTQSVFDEDLQKKIQENERLHIQVCLRHGSVCMYGLVYTKRLLFWICVHHYVFDQLHLCAGLFMSMDDVFMILHKNTR